MGSDIGKVVDSPRSLRILDRTGVLYLLAACQDTLTGDRIEDGRQYSRVGEYVHTREASRAREALGCGTLGLSIRKLYK